MTSCLLLWMSKPTSKIWSALQGKNWLLVEQIFSFKKGGKKENGRVALPESAPIHLRQLLNYNYPFKEAGASPWRARKLTGSWQGV